MRFISDLIYLLLCEKSVAFVRRSGQVKTKKTTYTQSCEETLDGFVELKDFCELASCYCIYSVSALINTQNMVDRTPEDVSGWDTVAL